MYIIMIRRIATTIPKTPSMLRRGICFAAAHPAAAVVRTAENALVEESRLFTYGQDSVMHLDLRELESPQVKLHTIWDDHTEANFFLENEEAIEDVCTVQEQGRDIFITGRPTVAQGDQRMFALNLPEYSNLSAHLKTGNLIQESTALIESRIKGNVTVHHSGNLAGDKILFQRVKTERVDIEVKKADLIFKKYLQAKQGRVVKRDVGRMEYKMLGVSEDLRLSINLTDLDVKNVYTNEVQSAEQINLSVDCTNSRGNIGIFNGSLRLLIDSSFLRISEAQFQYAHIQAANSSLDIFVREVAKEFKLEAADSRVVITTTKELAAVMREALLAAAPVSRNGKLFHLQSSGTGSIDIIEKDASENLFSYLTRYKRSASSTA
jgi:hypothetical protein